MFLIWNNANSVFHICVFCMRGFVCETVSGHVLCLYNRDISIQILLTLIFIY